MACPLEKNLLDKSPLTLGEYIELCLYHTSYGYYNKGNSVGVDYSTSPEISSMFGFTVANYLIRTWNEMGKPEKVHLIEMGPGLGTLMNQVLKGMESAPVFGGLEVHMVEVSSQLRSIQVEKQYAKKIKWHKTLPSDLDGFVMVIGNEFFDALAVDQYLLRDGVWHLRFVDIEEKKFFWKRAEKSPPFATNSNKGVKIEEGGIYEFSYQGREMAKQIGKLADLILMVDYGYESGNGDTIQAMRKGERVELLSCPPGTCDITSHVNFGELEEIWKDMSFKVHLSNQRQFLINNGIEEVFRRLCKSAESRGSLAQEYARLTGPMGNLFKVITATLLK